MGGVACQVFLRLFSVCFLLLSLFFLFFGQLHKLQIIYINRMKLFSFFLSFNIKDKHIVKRQHTFYKVHFCEILKKTILNFNFSKTFLDEDRSSFFQSSTKLTVLLCCIFVPDL